jgi:hypothetical protein
VFLDYQPDGVLSTETAWRRCRRPRREAATASLLAPIPGGVVAFHTTEQGSTVVEHAVRDPQAFGAWDPAADGDSGAAHSRTLSPRRGSPRADQIDSGGELSVISSEPVDDHGPSPELVTSLVLQQARTAGVSTLGEDYLDGGFPTSSYLLGGGDELTAASRQRGRVRWWS